MTNVAIKIEEISKCTCRKATYQARDRIAISILVTTLAMLPKSTESLFHDVKEHMLTEMRQRAK